MNEPVIELRAADGDEGRMRVLSPGVGWWTDAPHAGALVGPGTRIGRLTVLNRTFVLVLPEGASGRVTGVLPRSRQTPVQYGQALFELAPVDLDAADGSAVAEGPARREDVPEGARAVVSPTDGFFYRRPSPDDPPFTAVGQRVRTGQPVGLVEVMKTFNQILYGGPGFPEEAEVREFRAEDGEEVRAGQVLLVVR